MKIVLLLGVIIIMASATTWASPALAHRSGCHSLHSCPSDSSSYTCGDLGYPCNGVTSIKDIEIKDIIVPLLVEATFEKIFERAPSAAESMYWKRRFRDDKGSLTKIRRTMRYYLSIGSFGPAPVKVAVVSIVSKINALFRAANSGRNPTASENRYWLTRLSDKPTEEAMQGAMTWHKQNGISH